MTDKSQLTDAPLLDIQALNTGFMQGRERRIVVDNISFKINPGETLALLGESGCGKSVSALSIMRLLPPGGVIDGGQVLFAGKNLLALPEVEMRRVRGSGISMIFQEPATSLNPVLTVGRQIAEVLETHTALKSDEVEEKVTSLLEAVGIADAKRRKDEYPFQFSGGMKQRVMIALALAADPQVLIADEPTTALDVTIQAQILELLRLQQTKRQMGMLLITHDLGVAAQMAHRLCIMYAGQIVEEAPRANFFASPRHPYSQKLFASLPGLGQRGRRLETIPGQVPRPGTIIAGCRFAARCPHAWARCHHEVPPLHEVDAFHHVRCHLVEEPEHALINKVKTEEAAPAVMAREATLLSVRDLEVHFPIRKGILKRTVGHVRAVDGVSLEIIRGKTLALVGESGCGKTTVGKALLQLIRPTGGSVTLEERELTSLSRHELRPLRRRMQMIFQDPFSSLNPHLSIGQIIAEGMQALGSAHGQKTDRSAINAAIGKLLEEVSLDASYIDRYPHEFSGGQRQRIAIARALAVQPELIVCDEPTSALDVSVQAQILNLLKSLQESLGLAYLFITHNFAAVEFLAHEVAVMYLGKIVERGSVQEVLNSPAHPYTQALLSAVPDPRAGISQQLIRLPGEMPSPAKPPAGCPFHPRCPHVHEPCYTQYPAVSSQTVTHQVHCHLYR